MIRAEVAGETTTVKELTQKQALYQHEHQYWHTTSAQHIVFRFWNILQVSMLANFNLPQFDGVFGLTFYLFAREALFRWVNIFEKGRKGPPALDPSANVWLLRQGSEISRILTMSDKMSCRERAPVFTVIGSLFNTDKVKIRQRQFSAPVSAAPPPPWLHRGNDKWLSGLRIWHFADSFVL